MKKNTLFLLVLLSLVGYSQKKHFVYLTDKVNTPFTITSPIDFLSQRSIDRRANQNIPILHRDLPVDPVYVDSIRSLGATVWYTSRWFNAVLIKADSLTLITINNLGFVDNSELLESPIKLQPFDEDLWISQNTKPIVIKEKGAETFGYGQSEAQVSMLGADIMHDLGYTGKGKIIAVHDNGFSNVDQISYFSKLRNENRILGTYDFVQNNDLVYDSGSHGTMVLSTMAAFAENEIIGTGYGASFYLFVTENTGGENIDEEVNWLIAAERSDSLGVDLINTSLGYSTFDNSNSNHTYADMDGRTTIISKASEIAANVGMVIVTSAGNLGGNSWFYISAPADADSIITVGAVDVFEQKASFSSFGPSADGRIKPDLAAMGVSSVVVDPSGGTLFANGTSFSSPILCGMAAGFWEAHPELTGQEVIQYLKESASQYSKPDSLLGYGIPNFKIADDLATGREEQLSKFYAIFPNPIAFGEPFYISTSGIDTLRKIEIYNTIGQKVYEKELNIHYATFQVKTKSILSRGSYIIRIIFNKNKSLMSKFNIH